MASRQTVRSASSLASRSSATAPIAQLVFAPARSNPAAAVRNNRRNRSGRGSPVSSRPVLEQRTRLVAVDLQRFGDELRLAARKEVVDGANRRPAARHHLLDAGAGEAALAQQGFGGSEHPLAAGA